jgi:hypothetical protein
LRERRGFFHREAKKREGIQENIATDKNQMTTDQFNTNQFRLSYLCASAFSSTAIPLRCVLRVFAVILLVFCGACQQPRMPATFYTGPTATLDEIVGKINANNSQIPTLWSREDFDGVIVDDKQQSHQINADGVILYRAPHELLITAHNEFGTVFEMGVTADNYWLKVVPSLDTLWWGKMANVGKPCAASIPIRPDLILDVLAVGAIDPNFGHEPYTVMRFNNDADAYMVDTVEKRADRLLVRKEVWYDRRTLLPGLVLLFDHNGRVVLQAHLTDFQPLGTGVAPSSPRIATTYKLFFPDSGSTMKFTLREQAISKNGVPRPGGIHMPDLNNPGVGQVIQVDRDCEK